MTAAKVIDGRRRKATATGTRKNAEPGVREGAAGEQGQHADRCDVDGGRRERELLAGRTEIHPGEHARAPRREQAERDEEPGLLGIRVREALAERDQRNGGQPKPGNDTL